MKSIKPSDLDKILVKSSILSNLPTRGKPNDMIYTTLQKLYEAGASPQRYQFLAKALGGVKKYGANTPITLLQILDINGFDDAIWALRVCDGAEKFSRLLACDYAEHALHIFEAKYDYDDGPRKAIEVSRRYSQGEATDEELDAARDAASDAAYDVEEAEWMTGGAAAWAVAWAAVWAAAKSGGAEWAAYAVARTARWAVRAEETKGTAALKWQEQRLREMLE